MPIHPLGGKTKGNNRFAVCSEGFLRDQSRLRNESRFAETRREAHQRGMKVISTLCESHGLGFGMMKNPAFLYKKCERRNHSAVRIGADVADLNYDNPELRNT
jgi:hypothetical protein